jgi:hypothetical protein
VSPGLGLAQKNRMFLVHNPFQSWHGGVNKEEGHGLNCQEMAFRSAFTVPKNSKRFSHLWTTPGYMKQQYGTQNQSRVPFSSFSKKQHLDDSQ